MADSGEISIPVPTRRRQIDNNGSADNHLAASEVLSTRTRSRTPSPARSIQLTRISNQQLDDSGNPRILLSREDAEALGRTMIDADGNTIVVPDMNVYQNRKTLAKGMMDLALLSANGNQLRYVLESQDRHPFYWPALIFILCSLVFQVAVGVGLILNAKYNVTDKKERCRANKVNNYVVIGIFLITILNVFISVFGVADPPPIINGVAVTSNNVTTTTTPTTPS